MTDDMTLLESVRSRDEKAIHKLMKTYNRLLWSIAAGILRGVGNEQDVEECVSDVWLALWQKPEGYDPQRGSLKTYLTILTRSRALDRFRSLKETDELDGNEPDQTPGMEDTLISEELFTRLREEIDALGEPDREILIRRYFFLQKPSAMAQNMALPVREINNRLYQAKKKLREELGNH